jgi:hypothetical protein
MDMDTFASDGTVAPATVPFTEEAVKKHLDMCITHWRAFSSTKMGLHYVDAYQSVRLSIFGELLPKDKEVAAANLRQNALEFVKKALPEASDIDIESAAEKIVKNLAYLTEGK